MRSLNPLRWLCGLPLLALGLLAQADKGGFDVSDYDRLLAKFVTEDGWVDYAGLRRERDALDRFLERAAGTEVGRWSGPEQLAFWINAYNARMLQMIIERPKLKSVSEDFGLFDRPFPAGARTLSLNDIEHRVLRGKAHKGKDALPGLAPPLDPRIHFALVCAAVDCPRLRPFAYTAENLEATMTENARLFVESPRHIRIQDGRLRVSSLMKWYAEDFGDPAAYLQGLLKGSRRPDAEDLRRKLASDYGRARFEYDWTVNDVRNRNR